MPRSESPTDDAHDPSELQEEILAKLEEAGVDTATNDQIMMIVEALEAMVYVCDTPNPPDESLAVSLVRVLPAARTALGRAPALPY